MCSRQVKNLFPVILECDNTHSITKEALPQIKLALTKILHPLSTEMVGENLQLVPKSIPIDTAEHVLDDISFEWPLAIYGHFLLSGLTFMFILWLTYLMWYTATSHTNFMAIKMNKFAKKQKTTLVRPLIKKLNLDKIKGLYRPVSTHKCLSKIVKHSMLNQFNDHCKQYNLIPDYHSVYGEEYSCETTLTKLVNNILWRMER